MAKNNRSSWFDRLNSSETIILFIMFVLVLLSIFLQGFISVDSSSQDVFKSNSDSDSSQQRDSIIVDTITLN